MQDAKRLTKVTGSERTKVLTEKNYRQNVVHVDSELVGHVGADLPFDSVHRGGTILPGRAGRGVHRHDKASDQILDSLRFLHLRRTPHIRRIAVKDDVDRNCQYCALHHATPQFPRHRPCVALFHRNSHSRLC